MVLLKWFHYAVLFLFMVATLSGCALMDELTEPDPVKPAKVPAPEPVVAKKELGSLWSPDSMWNHIYSAAASRAVGDIVTIKLDEPFKARVVRLSGVPIDPPGPGNTAERRAPASSPEGGAEASALVLRGRIEEVGPRGVYRISGTDTLKIGKIESTVTVNGRIRDRDIDGNDELQVTDVFDLALNVIKAPEDGSVGKVEVDHVSW